jgi:hypothetical protein
MKSCKILLPILILVFLCQCKRDKPYVPVTLCTDLSTNRDTVNLFLKGRWRWVEDRVRSRSGAVFYYTPKTQGYQDYINIYSDTIAFLRDGAPVLVHKFKIQKEADVTNWPDDSITILATYDLSGNNYIRHYRIGICKDFLVLYQSYRSDIEPDGIYKRMY